MNDVLNFWIPLSLMYEFDVAGEWNTRNTRLKCRDSPDLLGGTALMRRLSHSQSVTFNGFPDRSQKDPETVNFDCRLSRKSCLGTSYSLCYQWYSYEAKPNIFLSLSAFCVSCQTSLESILVKWNEEVTSFWIPSLPSNLLRHCT